jgi:hypothetical protein
MSKETDIKLISEFNKLENDLLQFIGKIEYLIREYRKEKNGQT